MKPISAASQPAVEAKSSSSESKTSAIPKATPEAPTAVNPTPAAAAPSILDPLKSIDVSSLDKLIDIRKEQERIKGYRGKAAEKKSSVTDAVFKRVMEDYGKRTAALETQSAPLKSAATDEYRKLKTLNDDITKRREQAQLEKDELEFRNTVGELSDEDLATNMKAPQKTIDQCGADQKAVDVIKTRFVDAFGSLDELENSMDPPTYSTDVAPTKTVAAAPAAGVERTTGIKPPSAQPAAPPPGTPTMVISSKTVQELVDPASDGRTMIAPPDFAMPSEPEHDDYDDDGATMMLSAAAIVIIEPASMSQEFQLGAINGIGRSEENQICLLNPGISRKHALIKAVPGGYSIKDLGSQNGTFVNGQRVTEKALTDGDTIDVGSVQFVFRMPWAPSSSAASGSRSSASSRSKR